MVLPQKEYIRGEEVNPITARLAMESIMVNCFTLERDGMIKKGKLKEQQSVTRMSLLVCTDYISSISYVHIDSYLIQLIVMMSTTPIIDPSMPTTDPSLTPSPTPSELCSTTDEPFSNELKIAIIAVFGTLIVCCIFIVIFFVFRKSSDERKEEENQEENQEIDELLNDKIGKYALTESAHIQMAEEMEGSLSIGLAADSRALTD